MPRFTSGQGVASGWHHDLGCWWATMACPRCAGADTCTDGFFSVFPTERDPRFFREFCGEKREPLSAAMARHPGADGHTWHRRTPMPTSPAQEKHQSPSGLRPLALGDWQASYHGVWPEISPAGKRAVSEQEMSRGEAESWSCQGWMERGIQSPGQGMALRASQRESSRR